MSMKLMVAAMGCKVGNPIRKLVLLKLADNANDQGECWPSYQYIADECEVSRSAVKGHIRALENAGFLQREFRKNGGINKSNLFHLTMGQGIPPAGQQVPEVGQDMPEGGADDALGGGAPDDPRTSHSFEPVTEPVKETKGAPAEISETEKSAERVAFYLHERLVEEIPEAKRLNPEKWVKEIERAIRIDEIPEGDLIRVIDWMHTGDKFWVANIQSGQKLREKYPTMAGQMRRPKPNNSKPTRRPGEFDDQREVRGERLS